MKKKITLLLVTLLLSQITCTTISAQTRQNTDKQTIYFEDGSYAITFITDVTPDDSSDIDVISEMKTVTKTKTTEYYNNSNKRMWSVQVKGTFIYGNGSASCTKSEISAASYYEYWKLFNKSASKKDNKAMASVTAKLMKDSTVYDTINKTVTLTCSPTGIFS